MLPGVEHFCTVSAENGVSIIANVSSTIVTAVLTGTGIKCALPNRLLTVNVGCPVGEYLSVANAECRVCPGNSEGTVSGLTVCPCVDGYYRAEGEEDRECTRKQLIATSSYIHLTQLACRQNCPKLMLHAHLTLKGAQYSNGV